jgi:hypothetical protein
MLCTVGLSTSQSAAESIIRNPNPPRYKVEIEPHFDVGMWDYGFGGYGFGARFSIPIMSPGFVKSINDSVAIGFGGDFVHYGNYHWACAGTVCPSADFWSLYVPVVLQWNFWLTEAWSVFGEPGVVFRDRISGCPDGLDCGSSWAVWPTFSVGARWMFVDGLSLTLRAGWPQGLSVGLSIF